MPFWRRNTPSDDQSGTPRWLTPEENPFGIVVLDCRPVTQTLVSTTSSVEIAQQYSALRASTGEELVEAVPTEPRHITCRLQYPLGLAHRVHGPLFKSAQMEDKWDIYLYADRIYFARSWSGQVAYVAEIRESSGTTDLIAITYDNRRHAGPDHAIGAVDFLLKSHVWNLEAPHPLPSDGGWDPTQLAVASFSLYGRRCWFGSFEDTTSIAGIRRQD